MKNYFYCALFSFLYFASCTEISKDVQVVDVSQSIGIQQKNVLFEKYTAVGCVNCPNSSQTVKGLKTQYGNRLIPIFIHTTPLSFPIDGVSNQYLGSDQIEDYVSFVDDFSSIPKGAVDRVLFDGEIDIVINTLSFTSKVIERLEEELLVELDIFTSYDNSTRFASVEVDLTPLTDIQLNDLILTVVLVEDSIIEAQLDGSETVEDYEHNHVLRDFFTPISGVSVEQLSLGDIVTKEFSLEIPSHIDAENCRVIGFLSRNGADKEVFQVNEANLVE